MPIKLIIFDCDGVLVDSEPIADRIFPQTLVEDGFPVPLEDSLEWFRGFSLKSCLKFVENRFGRAPSKDFPEKYYTKLLAEFKKSLQPVCGIIDVLDTITYPTCVASSGEHEKMQVSLGITGLLPYFTGRIFSATEVAHGKPAPDLFLHAAAQCHTQPKDCAVIEDSAPGVTAGIRAGMTVFGYVSNHDAELTQTFNDLGAIVFNQMKDLPELLHKYNKKQ